MSDEQAELLSLAGEFSRAELVPRATEYERDARFPRELFRTLGSLGFLGLPYPEQFGGGGLPYAVYVRVIEELAKGWLTVGLGVSVHTLSAHPVATFGSADQQGVQLPAMLGGELLGAYCLSEAQSGSDAAGLATTATKMTGGYTLTGTKSWITHCSVADYYVVMARTGEHRTRGISCFLVSGSNPGISFGALERKMGMTGSPTGQVILTEAFVPESDMVGEPGDGFRIAMAALDSGRLGIAACSVGLAQAAFEVAVSYASQRQQFGQPINDFQGIRFTLADMATAIAAARALLSDAAQRRDAGEDYSSSAAMAKLFASDMCMQVCLDAVQILGGAGYVTDFPVERFMREAKVLQIVEGTNQIQREVIGRSLMH